MTPELECPIHGNHPVERMEFSCEVCGCRVWWVFLGTDYIGGELLCGACHPPKDVCRPGPQFTEAEIQNPGIPYEHWIRRERRKWFDAAPTSEKVQCKQKTRKVNHDEHITDKTGDCNVHLPGRTTNDCEPDK